MLNLHRLRKVLGRRKCARGRHDFPHTIGPGHPAITQTWISDDGKQATGTAGFITCSRCGEAVGPMDDGYPMIFPAQ